MQSYLLEVIACSVGDAVAAERGGAHRLEIISRYDVGGLTPPVELVREIAERVRIPLRLMLRQTESFEVSDKREIETLCEAARAFAALRIEGFVLGFLRQGQIDHELVARVLACAPKLKATFHRAFEGLTDPLQAIVELKRHQQIDCVLTSGGSDPWQDKVERLAVWQQAAQPEINILVGGGTDAEAIELLKPAGIRQFHVGRAVREGQRSDGTVIAELVRALNTLLEKSLV